jgi:hypothetical protein
MRKRDQASSDQRLFSFDDGPSALEREVAELEEQIASAKAKLATSSKYGWEWWDPWPADISVKDQYLLQIKRDMRGVEECEEEDERVFLQQRIESYRETLRGM